MSFERGERDRAVGKRKCPVCVCLSFDVNLSLWDFTTDTNAGHASSINYSEVNLTEYIIDDTFAQKEQYFPPGEFYGKGQSNYSF